ncbi:antitoxin Xre/MbcA/ParS toxin-binding domain-containing protein [Microbacterium suaedae]|uniref:antitoxin Xre/MbcA/ParS toxin-binding domain-containing protein n=1 Tax=Microbacterium suaedae TaxID=2067813 RepID=UPI000DA11E68|nr:antitoxin Xre/MbcA/ParS toxin-binding domain-containing protein [Microbacterium suaedae]
MAQQKAKKDAARKNLQHATSKPSDVGYVTVNSRGRATGLQPAGRAEIAESVLGTKARLAEALGVSASQPTRWISGEERPSAVNERALVDLNYVLERAQLLWGSEQVVRDWLYGHNGHLGGARPVDVIRLEGATPVIEALEAAWAGGYA